MIVAVLFPISGHAADVFDVVTKFAIAALFLVYGMRIESRAAWEGLKNWRLHSAIFAATYVLFPVLGLALYPIVSVALSHTVATGMLFLTLLPSTVQSSVAFTSIARGNVAAAVCAASLSNILGMFITPLLVSLFMGASTGGISWSSAGEIFVQMLLPFIVGQLLQPKVGRWVRGQRWLVVVVDRGTILLVVYSAFSAGIVAGIWTGLTVGSIAILLGFCAVLLTIMLCATWWLGGLAKFPRGDRIALLMCGSKKSLASGVPMASVLFNPATAAAVTLPLMVFHQLQLMTCAVLARRLAASDPHPPPLESASHPDGSSTETQW